MTLSDLPVLGTVAPSLQKPEPRKRVKARKDRAEAKVKQQVRARCVERDGDCRLRGAYGFTCSGDSEWAHLGESRRAHTRGMAPEVRHTTAGSLMLCTGHHRAYDAGRLKVRCLTLKRADGLLGFWDADHREEITR